MAVVKATPVYLEIGRKRVFACAVDWPGWCRSAKTEELAIETLVAYLPRYAAVAARAGVEMPTAAGDDFAVVERLPGSGATDFGVPGAVPAADTEPVSRAAAGRLAELVEASWNVFDEVAAGAPEQLRKGPRGGGRDRDKIVSHVVEAESGYARPIGLKLKSPAFDDAPAIAANRAEILAVMATPSDGARLTERGWPQRYAARRIAWHVLDHAWEIEDRTDR